MQQKVKYNGANDYLVKPFRTGELLARIRSALRKSHSALNIPTVNFKDFTIDFVNRIVKITDTVVKLLVRKEGKMRTHKYLLNEVWGPSHQNESQYLGVFIAQLRKKVESDPNRPKHSITESGIGYRFIGNSTVIE